DLEVRHHCPQAEVVYDLFHVVAKYGREVKGSAGFLYNDGVRISRGVIFDDNSSIIQVFSSCCSVNSKNPTTATTTGEDP
ncbi:hypothetical protein ACUNH4_22885, partial [Serratia sp. IR-2025]